MKPLIFDTFLYNGDEILTFRLEHLYNYVDYFVIVESLETFSGVRKSEYFIDKMLPALYKYRDKMVIVKVDKIPPRDPSYTFSSNNNPDDWWRERAQRDSCKNVIGELGGGKPFIALVGDVDEFPSHNLFKDVDELYRRTSRPMWLLMDFFYYNFLWKKSYKWDQYFVINDHTFFLDQLSQHKVFGDRQNHLVDGWHMSYFMSKDNIRKKVSNIGHTEFNRAEFKTEEHLNLCLKSGRDLFLRSEGENCILNNNFTNLPPGWEKFQRILTDIQCD